MNKKASWQTISSQIKYKNPWIQVREDNIIQPSGKKGIYGVVEKKDFVLIIPKINDDYFLVNQYRYPVKSDSWEFPQGACENNEEPKTTAKRELFEETGLGIITMKLLGTLWTAPALSTDCYSVFIATVEKKGKPILEESESGLYAQAFKMKKIKQMIKSGKIKDSPTIAALSLNLIA